MVSQPKRCTLYVNTVAYTENFHGGASFSSTWWSFVFGVRCLWRHNLASYWCFQTNVLAKFIDKICIFFNTRSPYFMCHCTEYKLPALKVRISEENTFNATTQQFTTAKISGCALKHRSKFHSSLTLRQSNLQLQNRPALMSRRIRAVENRRCAAGLAGAHPICTIEYCYSLLHYTRIENAHKVGYARKLSLFCYV